MTITDVTDSFQDGIALCAIIHRYRPDLIDFSSLDSEDVAVNNQLAFDILEELGVPPVITFSIKLISFYKIVNVVRFYPGDNWFRNGPICRSGQVDNALVSDTGARAFPRRDSVRQATKEGKPPSLNK